MRVVFLAALFLSFSIHCFSEIFILPAKYDNQEEVLIQGGSVIVSNKNNTVIMYQTCESIESRQANFYFSVLNESDRPINLYFSNLQVSDQWGRPIKVIDKRTQIEKEESRKNWRMFASAMCTGVDTINADKAGDIHYQTHTHSRYNSNFRTCRSNQNVIGSASGSACSTTTGTIRVEALRQQALRDVQQNARFREDMIRLNSDRLEHALSHFYFDSTTVFPGNSYGANFQIEIDKSIEKDLKHILLTVEFGGEEHTFCFFCHKEDKKWYRFGF